MGVLVDVTVGVSVRVGVAVGAEVMVGVAAGVRPQADNTTDRNTSTYIIFFILVVFSLFISDVIIPHLFRPGGEAPGVMFGRF